MPTQIIKNMAPATILPLAEQVNYMAGQIVSKTLTQNPAMNMTLFAFAKGEEISSHQSSGDAMVVCLDGEGKITIGDKEFKLTQGQTIVMPAKVAHAVFAAENFKMLLVVVFPPAL